MTSVLTLASRRRLADRLPAWWLAACVLSLLVASDYRLRTREASATLAGSADLAVFIEVAVYAAVGLVIFVASAQQRDRQPTSRLLHVMWAASGLLVASVLYSAFGLFSTVRAAQLLVVTALAHVAARYASRAQLSDVARLFTLAVGVSVVLGLVVPFERAGAAGDRFTWLHVHPVVAGSYLALAVLFLACHLRERSDRLDGVRWPPVVHWALLVVCVFGLLATQTRGAIVAVGVGFLVAVWLRSSRSRRVDLVVGGTLAGGAVALLAGNVLVEYFRRGESTERLASLNSRTELWTMMLDLWSQRPLLGHGLGSARGMLLAETGLGGAHNAVVNILLDAGAVGLVLWSVLVIAVVRYLLVLRRNPHTRVMACTLLGAMTVLLVNSLTVEFLVVPATVASTWLLVIVAWTVVLAREASEPGAQP